ncbi:E3 ubiquitin-protein ligase TRIM39-like [Sparus aurata]|uniref:E3 ubiquitin-protein ligase TRIM39-like n=1 Tax=Sparus aurata TaxID=8175 RepID=A0A671VS20_SPAAU|nr:E3 ubiquitin-protein ligase TRIM39-like [Sparus aurata]XP_030295211.1 E3 ubiquitin-protein ligase TRIM39-like [Sparus aurata]
MAAANSREEQLQCSICLNVFSEPVTTPCGHNYCKTCITGYWASSGIARCPLCQKKFRNRPELQVNTEFRDMVERFNSMRMRGEDDDPAKPGEVPCDVCPGPKGKAQKTCMVCLVSYCRPHLEQHQRLTRKHQLMDPVSNLEDRVCTKHNKMFELFCQVDQTCVCFLCLRDNHATHEAVPLERAFRERKARMVDVMSEIEMMENKKSRSIREIKHSAEQNKKESEKEIADVAEAFTALVASLQRSQAELIELIEEKHKEAERQAENRVAQLEQDVAELRRRRLEMKCLLQTEDHLHLLQSCPSLHSPAHTFNPLSHSSPPITPDLSGVSQHGYVRLVKKALAQMEKSLSNEMQMLIHEVRLSDGCEAAAQPDAAERLTADEFIKEGWNPPQDKLMMIQQCHAVDVTMDNYTANSKLEVSEDGKQLRFHDGRLSLHALFGRRFTFLPFVLGKEGFSSGRFYYEVQVSRSKCFVLGVVKESIDREAFSFPIPENGGWLFSKLINGYQEEYRGNFVEPPLNLRQRPQTVGVFVDYEKGEVSFYDVDARTLIYSYTGCTFTETTPALKAFLYSMTGAPLSGRPKLYPIFGMYETGVNREVPNEFLAITPVAPCN